LHLRQDRRVVFVRWLELERLKPLAKMGRTLYGDRSETKQKNGNDDNDVHTRRARK